MRPAAAEIAQLAVDAPEDSLLWLAKPNLVVVAEAGRLLPIAGRLVARTIPWLLETDDPQHPAVVGHRRALAGSVAPYGTLFRRHSYDVMVAPVVEDGTVVGIKGAAVLRGNRRWMDEVWRPRLTVLGGGAVQPRSPVDDPVVTFRVLKDASRFGLYRDMTLLLRGSQLMVPGGRTTLGIEKLSYLVNARIVALATSPPPPCPHLHLLR